MCDTVSVFLSDNCGRHFTFATFPSNKVGSSSEIYCFFEMLVESKLLIAPEAVSTTDSYFNLSTKDGNKDLVMSPSWSHGSEIVHRTDLDARSGHYTAYFATSSSRLSGKTLWTLTFVGKCHTRHESGRQTRVSKSRLLMMSTWSLVWDYFSQFE